MLEFLSSRLGWKLILLKSGVKMRFAVCGEYHLLALPPLRALFGFLSVEGLFPFSWHGVHALSDIPQGLWRGNKSR